MRKCARPFLLVTNNIGIYNFDKTDEQITCPRGEWLELKTIPITPSFCVQVGCKLLLRSLHCLKKEPPHEALILMRRFCLAHSYGKNGFISVVIEHEHGIAGLTGFL